MNDDFLKQFSNALADEHDGAISVPEATRGRVIRALAEKRRRSRKWWVVGVPALAIFGGSTAWAAATGKLPAIIENAVAVFVAAPEEAPPPQKSAPPAENGSSYAKHSLPPSSASDANAQASADTSRDSPVPESQSQPAEHKPSRTTNSRPLQTPVPEAAPNEAPQAGALSIYRTAHRAHFQEGDCAQAISGYQRYLSEDPSGSFALEAKYNRGVCLAKMGRTDEAVRALRPFADGQFGDYRQEKSRALIEALGSSKPD